jgi:plastocyanin
VTALTALPNGVAVGVGEASAEGISKEAFGGSPVIGGAMGLASAGRLVFIAAGNRGLMAARDESVAAATVNVNVGNFFFSPSTASINQGDTVRWNWVGGTHTTTSGTCPGGSCTSNGLWDSGTKSSGNFSHTFPDAGTFPYFCEVHGSSMTGKVNVQSTGPTPLSATASVSTDSGDVPLTVSFTGTASGGTPPYTYSWTLGDGSSSADQNPTHTYTQIGSYTAVLTVHDSTGATAQSEGKTITVHAPSTNPPVITLIKKVSPPFGIVVTGSNLQNGIEVFINGVHWDSAVWKSTGKVKLGGGKSLKSAVPKGVTTQFRFENPDGGSATATFSW